MTEDWVYTRVPRMDGGENLRDLSELLEENQLLLAQNVYFNGGFVYGDSGYTTFHETVDGVPLRTFQHKFRSGTTQQFLWTTTRLYIEIASEWQYVDDGTKTTTTGTVAAGGTAVALTDGSNWADADVIGIELSDGTQHQTTIASGGGTNSIVITDAIAVGKDVETGADVVRAVVLSGNLDKHISITTWTDTDEIIFVNGVNAVYVYNTTNGWAKPLTGTSPPTGVSILGDAVAATISTAQAIVVFKNQLLILNPTVSGTVYPQRIYRTEIDDYTDLTGGNAGSEDLWDNSDAILTAAVIGPYLGIYRDNSIGRYEYIGSVNELFRYTQVITGEGISSGRALAVLPDQHIFMGQTNFWSYKGDFSIEPIGDLIAESVFSQNGDQNPGEIDRSWALRVDELDEVWFFYPTGSNSNPTITRRYNYKTKAWSRRIFADEFIGGGPDQSTSSKTWNEVTDTWQAATYAWNATKLQANSPTILLCQADGSQVFIFDYVSSDDNGTTKTITLTTKDYSDPEFKLRLDFVQFLASGGTITIEYSTNNGTTYSTYGTKTLGSGVEVHRLYKQIVAQRFRFRITVDSLALKLGWFGFRISKPN